MKEPLSQPARPGPNRILLRVLSVLLAALFAVLAGYGAYRVFSGFFGTEPSPTDSSLDSLRFPENLTPAKKPTVILKELQNALPTVLLTGADGSVRYGSGFFLAENGYLVCSSRMTEDPKEGDSLSVVAGGRAFSASVLLSSPRLGLAVLRVDDPPEDGFALVSAQWNKPLSRGEELMAVGSYLPELFYGAAESGLCVSESLSLSLSGQTLSYYLLSLPMTDSLEGAPAVDENGEVFGICTGKLVPEDSGLCAVIPWESLFRWSNESLID